MRPARARAVSGSSRMRHAGNVLDPHADGARCTRRSEASGPSGTQVAPARRLPPSPISSVPAPSATRIASTARPGRSVPPASTRSGTRRIGPSGSAAATRAPNPWTAAASSAGGAANPSDRQISGTDTAPLVNTSVPGKFSSLAPLSSPKPSTEGTARSASAISRSPSGKAAARGTDAGPSSALAEKRSGPARRMSTAITAGVPAPAAPTSAASRARGQGHGPRRVSVSRSISIIAISGPVAGRSGSSGRSRSKPRSRSASRTVRDGKHQVPSRIASAAAPNSPGGRPRFVAGCHHHWPARGCSGALQPAGSSEAVTTRARRM